MVENRVKSEITHSKPYKKQYLKEETEMLKGLWVKHEGLYELLKFDSKKHYNCEGTVLNSILAKKIDKMPLITKPSKYCDEDALHRLS